MPRTKLQKHAERNKRSVALFWGEATAHNFSQEELARAFGISTATLSRRKAHPERFTIDEVTRAGQALSIPLEELRRIIVY